MIRIVEGALAAGLLFSAGFSMSLWSASSSKQEASDFEQRQKQLTEQLLEFQDKYNKSLKSGKVSENVDNLSAITFILWQLQRLDEACETAELAIANSSPKEQLPLLGAIASMKRDQQEFDEAEVILKKMVVIENQLSLRDQASRDKQNLVLIQDLKQRCACHPVVAP